MLIFSSLSRVGWAFCLFPTAEVNYIRAGCCGEPREGAAFRATKGADAPLASQAYHPLLLSHNTAPRLYFPSAGCPLWCGLCVMLVPAVRPLAPRRGKPKLHFPLCFFVPRSVRASHSDAFRAGTFNRVCAVSAKVLFNAGGASRRDAWGQPRPQQLAPPP